MGDRGNVYVHAGDFPGVYLYSHWGGSGLAETTRRALARGRDRWDDDQYLARIIFCEMVKNDLEGTTGYGISAYQGDGDLICSVDCETKTVTVGGIRMPISTFVNQTAPAR